MTDKTLALDLVEYNINGIIHVGANTGEYARYYHRLGIHMVMWLEANKSLYPLLYENTKNFGMNQRIFMENLANRSFKSVWREHAAFIDNIRGYDALHIAGGQNQKKILEGFEDMLELFKLVVISSKAENEEEDNDTVVFLSKNGFHLTSFSTEYSERLFAKVPNEAEIYY